jgi:hypothetical protein
MIHVEIKLRVCTRCGHFECPHCRNWCDVCLEAYDEDEDDEDDTHPACVETMECTYATEPDTAGYARLEALQAAHHHYYGDTTEEDGSITLFETKEEVDAWHAKHAANDSANG